MTTQSYAIIIGVSKYQDKQVIPELPEALESAKKFRECLLRNNMVADDKDYLKYLTDGSDGSSVTLQGVNTAITEVLEHSYKKGETTRLYVYYAGHGISKNRDEHLLLLGDTSSKPWEISLTINRRVYENCLSAFDIFSDQICFFESCRPRRGQYLTNKPPWCSCEDQVCTQVSYYATRDEDYARTVHSKIGLFTDCVIDGLDGFAATPDGQVTCESLDIYLKEIVRDRAAKEGGAQYPTSTVAGNMDLVLTNSTVNFLVEVKSRTPKTFSIKTKFGITVVSRSTSSDGSVVEMGPGLFTVESETGPPIVLDLRTAPLSRRLEI